jgi:hypothetical protein
MPRSGAFNMGSTNLKGKLTMRLRCGCCNAFNCKQAVLEKEHAKEIKLYLKGVSDENEY